MRLRTAKKILKSVGTVRGRCYSGRQIRLSLARMERTKSARFDKEYWQKLMLSLGVRGRVEVLAGSGAPGMAFGLLMRMPIQDWRYGG